MVTFLIKSGKSPVSIEKSNKQRGLVYGKNSYESGFFMILQAVKRIANICFDDGKIS